MKDIGYRQLRFISHISTMAHMHAFKLQLPIRINAVQAASLQYSTESSLCFISARPADSGHPEWLQIEITRLQC